VTKLTNVLEASSTRNTPTTSNNIAMTARRKRITKLS
jgi:hypothetical protein